MNWKCFAIPVLSSGKTQLILQAGIFFFKIMAPMILPTVFVAVIFRFIDCVKVFDVIWGMTAGGPGSSTLTLSIQGYVLSFSAMDIAKGNTVLGLIWIINLVLGNKLLDFWRVSRERLGS